MIIINIVRTKNSLIKDGIDFKDAMDAIMTSLFRKPEFLRYFPRCSCTCNGEVLTIKIKGISFTTEQLLRVNKYGTDQDETRDNDSEKAAQYVMNFFETEIFFLGLSNHIQVKDLTPVAEIGDKLLVLQDFSPREGINASLAKHVDADLVPENYTCLISSEIMDNPVYANFAPNYKFDAANLLYLINQGGEFLHPYTRQPMTRENIVYDNALKIQIDQYAREQFQQSLIRKNQTYILKMNHYESNQPLNSETHERAFRKAAAANDLEGLKVLLCKIINIDNQDKNPKNRKTALHWSVIKGAVETAKYLLENDADPFIPDAFGKTAIDYAVENNNLAVIKLFNPGYRAPELKENIEENNTNTLKK